MLEKFVSNWWKFALRGMFAIIFGIVALVKPGQTLQALVLAFGAFALVDGFLAVFASFSLAPFYNKWWTLLLEGIAGTIIGLVTLFLPNITAVSLLYVIGAWAVVTGILEIGSAIQLRRLITGEWMMILGGLLSIAFGVLVFVYPASGALSLAWLIGYYAIAFGISEIVLAFRLHNTREELKKISAIAN